MKYPSQSHQAVVAVTEPRMRCICVVTGVAGFIGSHLAEALIERGHQVYGIDDLDDYYSPALKQENLRNLLKSTNFSFLERDLNCISSDILPAHVDFVFHLAGQPGVRSSWSCSFDAYVRSNVVATQRLLELVKHLDIRRFVFASSSSVYGQTRLPATEQTLPHPISPYAATKLAAEGLCLAYSSEFSIPLTVLRYFTVYGPRQRPDMAIQRFLSAVLTQTPVSVFGSGDQLRTFTYVEDVVAASLAVMSEDSAASVYNIGGDRAIKLEDCLAIIERVTGRSIWRQACGEMPGDPFETRADISAARRCLGFNPRVCIEEGIARQWEWLFTHTPAVSRIAG
jgi:nucleoside-diphosphate-sugar epimerase